MKILSPKKKISFLNELLLALFKKRIIARRQNDSKKLSDLNREIRDLKKQRTALQN